MNSSKWKPEIGGKLRFFICTKRKIMLMQRLYLWNSKFLHLMLMIDAIVH